MNERRKSCALNTLMIIAVLAGGTPGAHAQHAGDVFMRQFSWGVHADKDETIELAFFGGNKHFERVRGRILWNPALLEVAQARMPKQWEDRLTGNYALERGTLAFDVQAVDDAPCGIRTVPPRPSCAPIGTVPVVSFSARSDAPPGTVIAIDLTLDEARCEGKCAYRRTGAMPGEIVVVAQGIPIPPYGEGANLHSPLVVRAGDPLAARVRRIARGAGVIDLLIVREAFAERRWVRAGPAPVLSD